MRIVRIIALAFAMTSTIAHSIPVYGPTGNAYEFINVGGITWADAKNSATSLSYMGVAGHLVTIFDQSENDFVLSLLSGVSGAVWIGATDEVTEGEWKWVTGETFWQGGVSGTTGPDINYANWVPGLEPNGDVSGVPEDYATMFGQGVPTETNVAPGLWNDIYAQGGDAIDPYLNLGYVVEYDVSSVPIPAAVILFVSGLAFLQVLVRRKNV